MAYLLNSIIPNPRRTIAMVHPDISVAQCVAMMVQDNIGALVVTDDTNILGILSERDIVRSLVHQGLSAETTKVSDILCAEFSMLSPVDTVENAMQVMTTTRRRHILVMENGELIAIVSIGDLLFKLLADKEQVIEQLENYIHT